MIRLILTALLFASTALAAQPDASAFTSMATGGTTARTLASRAASSMTVEDFGAVGDGVTDDTAAFTAYATYLHAQKVAGHPQRSWALGAGRTYVVKQSINLTGFSHMQFEGHGSMILSSETAYPVIDMLGSSDIVLHDLRIYAGSQGAPAITGIRLGVYNNTQGYPENTLDGVEVDGYYSQADVHNRGSEVFSMTSSVVLINRYAPGSSYAYALIEDGTAHFPITSRFITDARTPDMATSFTVQNITGAKLYNTGGGPDVWMSAAGQVSFDGVYLNTTGSVPAVQMYFYDTTGAAAVMTNQRWYVHSEVVPSSIFQLYGIAAPTINGLEYADQQFLATGSLISLGAGATSATVTGLNVRIGRDYRNAPLVDIPANYTLTGLVYCPDAPLFNVNTAAFNGIADIAGVTTYYGVSDTALQLPSVLPANSVVNAGSVSSVALTYGGNYGQLTSGTLVFPTCTLSGGGGSGASCTVANMGFNGPKSIVSGGTGYVLNDIVTPANAGTCVSPPRFVVTGVSDGVVTALSGASSGACAGNPVGQIPSMLSLTDLTTGSASGLTVNSVGWAISTAANGGVAVVGGSGYTSAPTVTFQTSNVNPGYTATGAATLNSSLTLSGGGAQIVLTSAGTKLGTAGPGGLPVLSQGALVDASGVRQSLGGSYIVPANTSLVRFIQTGTVSASTVTLPTALVDGQPIQFVNYAGAITALTFAPAVNGWTNGSALAAYTGLRIRWDATAAAWYREQ